MKRTIYQNRCLASCLAIVAMLMMSLGVKAQTVHIGLDNGSLVNAVTPGDETGWANGFSTLWRHEQLSLSMMGSDRDELTESGGIGYPSAVFGKHDGKITIVGGRRPSFMVVSLPKGYRITRYTIVLSNDLGPGVYTGNFANLNSNQEAYSSHGYGTMRFYEVEPWETDHTNAGTHGRSNGQGYDTDQVRYIEPGPNWETGQQIGSVVIKQAMNGSNGDIRTDQKGQKFTISRTAIQTGTDSNHQPIYDMGNQLYFRLVKDYCFYGITIEEFRIEFSAEGTFEADVVPDAVGQATSVVKSPFKTSKIDIGEMTEHTKDGATYFSFDYEHVKDLVANNYLYQADAVENGIPADVSPTPHISPVEVDGNLLYALKSDTYYIETPTEIVTGSGNTAPIGYRIVGALFTPLWGTATSGQTVPGADHYYITYTSGGTTYYLNDQGQFTTNKTTTWELDNNNYVHSGDAYLACSSNGYNNRTLSIGTSTTQQRLRKDNDGHFYYERGNGTFLYLHGATSASATPTVTNDQNNLAVWANEPDADIVYPSFTPGPYKLKIWKRDGKGLIHWTSDDSGIHQTNDTTKPDYIEISGADDTDLSKVIDIGLCNNDAIKFEIETTGENAANTQALVQVTLLLQALDPYIDKMDIVCTDNREVLHLTQSFTADDFSVSGGKFIFYVPTDYVGQLLTFTFSDLYSKYGDETYYDGGSGTARYSFVTSPYFLGKVDGNGNDGLYDSQYSPDAVYTNKVYTSTAGNIRFKFNNAEDLQVGGNQEDGYLEEYPFSVPIYLASTDPGDPLSSPEPTQANPNKNGEFIPVKLKASTNQDENSGTFFVFTADETRWNIAPTKNWQHRYYAFYRMEIEVRAKTFIPDFTWTQIYDKTSYAGKDNDGKEIDLEKSMWGVTLDVADEEDGQKVQGYLTYQEIINAINAQIADDDIDTPEGTDQILYIDGTPLYAMLKSAEGTDVIDVEDLQPLLAKNALIFLPENTTSLEDNVAYETTTGFVAGKDIVLTDKLPFFTPYDIYVASANSATYRREKSGPNSGLVTHGTVVLPFTLRVNGGKHVNDPEDGFEFNVRSLAGLASPDATQTGNNNYYSEGNFTLIEGTSTEANKPYMVEVTATPSENSNYSFVVSQKGSTIYATPFEKDANGKITKGDKNFPGETATNGKDGGSLTNYGTYSGMTIPKENNVYYFNKDKYVSSTTLATKYENAIVRPFRAYYAPDSYEVALFSKMIGFNFVYDLFSDNGGITTSLTETYKPKVMTITTEKGSMLINAKENIQVKILSANGVNVDGFYMNAGEQRLVNVPSGIYIVNNTKILVK